MDQENNNNTVGDDITKALDKLQSSNKKDTSDDNKIDLPDTKSYGSNPFSSTVNKLLSENIDQKAGNVYFGENLARMMEFYGLKSGHPVIAFILSCVFVGIVAFDKIFQGKKEAKKEEGIL